MILHGSRISGSTLMVYNCQSVGISECEISNVTEGPGLEIRDSNSIRIYNSTIRGCNVGVLVNHSWNCLLIGNRIIDSELNGIECVWSGGNIYAYGNLILNSGSNGIDLSARYSGWDNIIANNTIIGSKGYALYLPYYSDGWVYGNTFIMNNGTTDRLDPLRSQIFIGEYMVMYDPNSREGNYWYDVEDGSRKQIIRSHNGYDNFDPDRSRVGDLYPLAYPSSGSPEAPGHEDLWEGGMVMDMDRDYTSGFCCLSVVLVMFLLIVFIARNNAVNKRDINLQHRKRPWEYEEPEDGWGRITPKELQKPVK
jgi:hypothetical protein